MDLTRAVGSRCLQRWLTRFRTEVRAGLELILLPGMVVFLPWPWCYRFFGWLSRHCEWLYRQSTQDALAQVKAFGLLREPERDWTTKRRLLTLVDHADLYLIMTRSSAWWHQHVKSMGTWPSKTKPALLITFHWGAGMWSLADMRAAGLEVHALAAAPQRGWFAGQSLAWRYASWRMAAIRRTTGHPPIDVATHLRPAYRALDAGHQLLALVDVPSDASSGMRQMRMLDHQARWPASLFRLARQRELAVHVYMMNLDWRTGRRRLAIHSMDFGDSWESLMDATFRIFEDQLQNDSASWHFWPQAPRIFVEPHAGQHSDGSRIQ